MNSTIGLHHVLLTVRDLTCSTAFYEDLLGLRKIKEIPDDGIAGAKVLFALPDGRLLGLVSHRTQSGEAFDEHRIGLDHLALSVPVEDLPTWGERLSAAGVAYSPPAPSAVGDPLIVFRDPDNIQLQLYGISKPIRA